MGEAATMKRGGVGARGMKRKRRCRGGKGRKEEVLIMDNERG